MKMLVSDRALPSNIDLEKIILGTALVDKLALSMMLEKVSANDFYSSRHGDIYAAIKAMVNKQMVVDMVSLPTYLEFINQSDHIDYVIELADKMCTIGNYESHLELMLNISMMRKLIIASGEISRLAYGYDQLDMHFDDIADKANGLISESVSKAVKSNESGMTEIMGMVFDRMQKTTCGDTDMLKTYYPKLDSFLSIEPGDFVIIAGRPGMGKTAFATSVALNMAKNGVGSAIFNLEMTKLSLGQRILSQETELSLFDIRNSVMARKYYEKMSLVAGMVADLPIEIDDTPLLSLGVFRSKLRKMISKYNIKVAFIDYLQLMDRGDIQDANAGLEKLSRGLKLTAKEFNIPIVALSQLSRDNEKRGKNKYPQLSDLRGSGAIEQDADTVIFTHRQNVYDKDHPQEDAEIIVAKQRNGSCETAHLEYVPKCAKFKAIPEHREQQSESGF